MNSQRIVEQLLDWYSAHYRPLPWRNFASPYQVWVSEIMLQQTRIEAVLSYYRRFIDALPTIGDLASAPEDLLLKLWEGLGYYSRVRNMQKAAKILVDKFDGNLPADYDALLSLPGIGAYTAGAIASIAYDIPVPAVDGNVMRVLARLTADDTDVLSAAGKKRFTDLAWEITPEKQAGRFNQALMELGETICIPNGTPLCATCPLKNECEAHLHNCVDRLPVRIKKTVRRVENRWVVLVRSETQPATVLLHKRTGKGLLANLWEFPNTLSDNPLDSLPREIADACVFVDELPPAKHLFSHIEWHMCGRSYLLSESVQLPEDYALVTLDQLRLSYSVPGAFRVYSALLPRFLNEES